MAENNNCIENTYKINKNNARPCDQLQMFRAHGALNIPEFICANCTKQRTYLEPLTKQKACGRDATAQNTMRNKDNEHNGQFITSHKAPRQVQVSHLVKLSLRYVDATRNAMQ